MPASHSTSEHVGAISGLIPSGHASVTAPPGRWLAHDQLRALALVVDRVGGYDVGTPVHLIAVKDGFAYLAVSFGRRHVWLRYDLGSGTVDQATVDAPEWRPLMRVRWRRRWRRGWFVVELGQKDSPAEEDGRRA